MLKRACKKVEITPVVQHIVIFILRMYDVGRNNVIRDRVCISWQHIYATNVVCEDVMSWWTRCRGSPTKWFNVFCQPTTVFRKWPNSKQDTSHPAVYDHQFIRSVNTMNISVYMSSMLHKGADHHIMFFGDVVSGGTVGVSACNRRLVHI